MPEWNITSPYVLSRVDYNTFTMGQPYARVDLNPMPEPTLSPSQGLWIWPLGPFQAEIRIGACLKKCTHAPIILYFTEANSSILFVRVYMIKSSSQCKGSAEFEGFFSMTCPFRFQLTLSVRSPFSKLLLAERSLEHNGFYNSTCSAVFYMYCIFKLHCRR
jgi:hypothetical protein